MNEELLLILLILFLVAISIVLPILNFLKLRKLQQDILKLRAKFVLQNLNSAPAPEPTASNISKTQINAQQQHSQSNNNDNTYANSGNSPELAMPAIDSNKTNKWQTKTPSLPRSHQPTIYHHTTNKLISWIQQNWVLLIAAVSLILGGLFMLQYGIEKGLLPPTVRVISALLIGFLLVAGGEYLRQRFGDQSNNLMQHIPATLAGAGLVIAFMACLSADILYDLISAQFAFSGLAIIAISAIVLGWLYGPVISAIGIIGGSLAPFLVAGDNQGAALLYYYFALLAVSGIAIDSLKRFVWLSYIALLVPSIGLFILWQAVPNSVALMLSSLLLATSAIIIPAWSIKPVHFEHPLFWALYRSSSALRIGMLGGLAPIFAACLLLYTTSDALSNYFGLGLLLLVYGAVSFWLNQSPALSLLALLSVLILLLNILSQPYHEGTLYKQYIEDHALKQFNTIWWVIIVSICMALIAFFRSRIRAIDQQYWVYAAASIIPVSILILEFQWYPTKQFGSTKSWATVCMVSAGIMVLMTQLRRRWDEQFHRDIGLLTCGSLVLVSLGLFVLFSESALAVALSLLVVVCSQLDRRFEMMPVIIVMHLVNLVLGYLLIFDPGIWGSIQDESLTDVILLYCSPLIAWSLVLRFGNGTRASTKALAESAWVLTLTQFASVLLLRQVELTINNAYIIGGIFTALWCATALAQCWRLPTTHKKIKPIRHTSIGISLIVVVASAVTMVGGLFQQVFFSQEEIIGLPIFNGLALSIWPLVLVLLAGYWKVLRSDYFNQKLRVSVLSVSGFFSILWLWLEIRRLWRGPVLSSPSTSDGELYTYTLVMLFIAIFTLVTAMYRRSLLLRRLAMIGIALTIAKVFIIDISGLSGLTRVMSFMGLGIALAALSWFNRWLDSNWANKTVLQKDEHGTHGTEV